MIWETPLFLEESPLYLPSQAPCTDKPDEEVRAASAGQAANCSEVQADGLCPGVGAAVCCQSCRHVGLRKMAAPAPDGQPGKKTEGRSEMEVRMQRLEEKCKGKGDNSDEKMQMEFLGMIPSCSDALDDEHIVHDMDFCNEDLCCDTCKMRAHKNSNHSDPAQNKCDEIMWPDVVVQSNAQTQTAHRMVCADCKALVRIDKHGGTCNAYCHSMGLKCTGAFAWARGFVRRTGFPEVPVGPAYRI